MLDARDVDAEIADAVLDRFAEVGLVDDEAFARSWVESRQRHKGLARSVLRQELRQRGVSPELIELALASIDDEDEHARALMLARSKLGAHRTQPPQVRLRRLAAVLARKGYSGQVAWVAARDALATEGHSETGVEAGESS